MSKFLNYSSDFPGQYDCKGYEDFSIRIEEAGGGFYTVDRDITWVIRENGKNVEGFRKGQIFLPPTRALSDKPKFLVIN